MTGTMDTETDTRPVDIATMRETVDRLLVPDAELPEDRELDSLTGLLRGHIELVIPELQSVAVKLPKDDILRYCALACAGEARGRLAPPAGSVPGRRLRVRPALGALAQRPRRLLRAPDRHERTLTLRPRPGWRPWRGGP